MAILVAGCHLPPKKHLWVALTHVHGIGKTTALRICEQVSLKMDMITGDLTDAEVEKIREAVKPLSTETDLRREVSMNIKKKMDLGCYQGIRHRRGLPVRGQRTKTNANTRRRRRRSN